MLFWRVIATLLNRNALQIFNRASFLRQMRELVGQRHAVVAVDVTHVSYDVVRVWKVIVDGEMVLVFLKGFLLLLLLRLLLCELILHNLVILVRISFDLCLCF